MVKQTEHLDFDFPDWDDFQDAGDGGFQTSSKKSGKRKAITEFGGSFLSGIKKQLLRPEIQRKFLDAALPDSGYVRLFDTAHVATDNVKQLAYGIKDDLTKASSEFKEPLKSLERTYRGNKFLPKKVSEKIQGWESDRSWNAPSAKQAESDSFNESINTIFSGMELGQAAASQQTKTAIKESSDKATVSSLLNTKATLSVAKALNETNAGIGRLVAFNEAITSRAMRKQLELQFKQYAVAREQLDVLQQTRDLHEASYKALILNTGLPEAIKITNAELAGQQLKKQLFGAVNKRIANNFKDIGSRMVDRAGTNIREFIETAAMGLGGALGAHADKAEFEKDMADVGMGESRAQKAGGLGASVASWLLATQGGKALGKRLQGNERVNRYSDMLLNTSDNLPHYFNRIVNERTNSTALNTLIDLLGLDDFTYKYNPKVRGSAVPDLDKQAFWNVQSQLALVEVIPGHLSTMSRYLEMLATGDSNAEARLYDYDTATFATESSLINKYQGRMFGADKATQVRASVDKVIEQMDSEGKLSSKAKNELRRYLLKTAQNDQAGVDVRALMSTDSPLSPEVAKEVADVLGGADNFNMPLDTDYRSYDHGDMIKGNMTGSNEYFRKSRNVNQLMTELRDVLPSNMQIAVDASKQGHTSILERIGAVNFVNGAYNIDRNKEIDFWLNGGQPPTGPETNTRTTAGPPRPLNPLGSYGSNNDVAQTALFKEQTVNPYLGPKVSDNVFSSEPNINIGAESLRMLQDGIIAAIDRNSTLENSRVSNELLEAIRVRLEEGVMTSEGTVETIAQKRKRSGFFNKLMAPLRAGVSGMKNYTQFMYGKLIPGVVKAPFKAAGAVLDSARNIFGGKGLFNTTARQVKNMVGDVYVKGKNSPILKAAEMAAGNYRDQATGKIIQTMKDIQGAVVDLQGNILVTQEDFDAGLYTLRNGRAVRLMSAIGRGAWGLAKGSVGLMTKPYVWAAKGAWGLTKLAGKAIFGTTSIQDVYVVGERSPRLLAAVINAGGYFNEDGSVIRTIDDIKGDIVDSTGNVVLTVAEMSRGIVDKYGKPIDSFKKRSMSLLGLAGGLTKSLAKGAWWLTKNSAKLYAKTAKGMFNLGRKGVSSLFGGKSTATGSLDEATLKMFAHQTDTLDNIYELLNDRLPKSRIKPFGDNDGDGLREGSREAWFAKVTKDKEAPTEEKKDDKKPPSLFGLIMAAVTGIGGLVGTLKGWASKIFTLMRATALMKGAGSLLGGVGSVMGRGRGHRGRRGGAGGFIRNNAGKLATLGILGGAAGYAFAGGDSKSLSTGFDALSKGEEAALKSVNGSGADTNLDQGGEDDGYWGNMGNAILGGIGGEAAGILAMSGLSGLGGLLGRKKREGQPDLVGPNVPANPAAKKKGKFGKVVDLLTKNKYGRLLTSAGTAAGGYAAWNAMTGKDEQVDTASTALKAMGTTMALDAGLEYGVPYLMDKFGKGKNVATAAEAAQAAGGLGTAATAAGSAAGSAAGRVAKSGIGSRLGSFGGKALGIAGKAAVPLALAAGAYNAYKEEGNIWKKGGAFLESAAPALAGAGLVKLAANPLARAAAMQAGRTVLTGAASLIAGTVGWPVVLAGAAIAGGGWLAYQGYKRWFKKDKEALVRFRMAQYGFDLDDKKHSEIILRLEKLAMDAVTVRNGSAEFTKNLKANEIVSLFGILSDDKESVEKFGMWFIYRFRPIFLKAYAVANKITKKKDLHEADNLMAREEKEQYLQETNTIETKPNPYDVTPSPFADQKKVPLSGEDVTKAFKTAVRDVKKEKSRNEKDKDTAKAELRDEVQRRERARTSNRLEYENDMRERYKRELAERAEKSGSIIDKAKSMAFNAYDAVADTKFGQGISNVYDKLTQMGRNAYETFTGTVQMSKSQKQWQLMVYKAFKTAGFSEMQSRILTAEVGRENSYNPAHLFGGHADPHSGANLGMISWQGNRRTQLARRLAQDGVLINGDKIAPGQKALDSQARFVMWELQNTETKAGKPFLAKPNISYNEGTYLIGKYYIRWRIDDPKYAAQGKKNRDGFYNMLNQQLGGGATATSDSNSSSANPTAQKASAPPAYLTRAGAKAGSGPASTGSPSGGQPLTKNGGVNTGGIMGGGNIGSLMSTLNSGGSSNGLNQSGLNAFFKGVNRAHIALGQKCTYLADSGVDVKGMNMQFMAIFYIMAYEYNQRTGKKIRINSAYRSVAKQKALYDAWIARGKTGGAVARPGNSRHNSGVAIDIASVNANELDSLGLLKKYNFHRPVRGEAWHLENHFFNGGKLTQQALKQAAAGGVPSATQQQQAASRTPESTNTTPAGGPVRPVRGSGVADLGNFGKVTPETVASPTVTPRVNVPGMNGSGSTAEPAARTTKAQEQTTQVARSRASITNSQVTERSATIAETTNRRQEASSSAQLTEQTSIMKEQLSVQRDMAKTLSEIKAALSRPVQQAPTQQARVEPAPSKGIESPPPVSMSVKS